MNRKQLYFLGAACLCANLHAQLPKASEPEGWKSKSAAMSEQKRTTYVADSVENRIAERYTNNVNPNDTLQLRTKNGIYIVGKGPQLRAMIPFSGKSDGGVWYSETINKYQQLMGDSIRVYSMIVPVAAEFYTPKQAEEFNTSARPTIDNMYLHLSPEVTAVDVYTPLARHAKERTYSRTDHHWSPLGAYYGAQRFASLARLPFKTLDNYERRVIKAYVGSMWHFTKSPLVKSSRDSFEFYVPKGVELTTTYTNFRRGKNRQILGEKEPEQGDFFLNLPDSSFNSYCSFMGGDEKIVHVKTSTKNGRRLMVIKDSFGNAVVPFLFYSFEEIFVVDFRYFKRNIVDYAHQGKITDLLIVNNISHAYSPKTAVKLEQLLQQGKTAQQ